MTQNAVEVEDLRKVYGERSVVDGVSFEIKQGETFALLGPNGAGKSTTVEILEGYRRRSAGQVRVLGVDPTHGNAGWKSKLGIVLQTTGQAGAVTVREQIRHFAGLYPNPRDVDEVISAVGLTQHAKTRIAKLSGGQQRRVDVALGVIGNPELVFLDEPTTGFDPHARREFWELIRGLKREGASIVLTTHYLDEAAHLADRVGVIAGGRMQAIGETHSLGPESARMPVVRWYEDGAPREHRTSEPLEYATALAARFGGEPPELQIVRPSLEDVYLSLVADVDAGALPTGVER